MVVLYALQSIPVLLLSTEEFDPIVALPPTKTNDDGGDPNNSSSLLQKRSGEIERHLTVLRAIHVHFSSLTGEERESEVPYGSRFPRCLGNF